MSLIVFASSITSSIMLLLTEQIDRMASHGEKGFY